MKKLALSAAISAILATPAFAASYSYSTAASSGTAANSAAGIVVQAGSPTSVYYVANSSGTASNLSDPSVQLIVSGDWSFDTTSGAFTGNIAYGDYKTQTSVTGSVTIDGRQTYTGVNQALTGTGTWTDATHFTYTFLNTTVNGGGASTQTQTSASCANGATSALGKVCTSFTQASKDWEGLTLNFTFASDYSTFNGALAATDTSGSGLTRNTTTINWQIAGTNNSTPEVPVPAAAWLFGSGLIGLASTARRRKV